MQLAADPKQKPDEQKEQPVPAAPPKLVAPPPGAAQVPQNPAVPVQRQIKDPQVVVEIRRADPATKLADVADPSANPAAWVEQVIKRGNSDREGKPVRDDKRKYSDFYIVFKDKNNPDKVVAALPIENAYMPSSGGVPAAISGRGNDQITGISFGKFDAGSKSFSKVQSQQVEKWESERRTEVYGNGPEGGSNNVVRLVFDFAPNFGVDSGIRQGHAIITFDADGQPTRFMMPNFTDDSGAKFIPSEGVRERQVLLRPPVKGNDLPKTELVRERVLPTPTVDLKGMTQEGDKKTYPVTFPVERQGSNQKTELKGFLVVEKGKFWMEPSTDARLQSAFASIGVTFNSSGEPLLQQWRPTRDSFGSAPETGARVTIDGKEYHNQSVFPVRFVAADGKQQRGAFAFISPDNKMHILSKDQVTLLRPSITVGAAISGKPGEFTAAVIDRSVDDTGLVKETRIDGRVVVANGGVQVLATDPKLQETVNRLRAQLVVDTPKDKPPVFSAKLPFTAEQASPAEANDVARFIPPFKPNFDAIKKVLTVGAVPGAADQFRMKVATGKDTSAEIDVSAYLPPGVDLTGIGLLKQSTTLNGVRVLPFRFTTSKPVGEPPKTEHEGYLRLGEDGLTLRQQGQGTSVQMKTELRVTGVRIFPELKKDAHSDNGFVPIK
jgi:hypothetical protein